MYVGEFEDMMCVVYYKGGMSTLCKYDLRMGDLLSLTWARVRRVRRESISSELLMYGGGVRSILLLSLVARFRKTIVSRDGVLNDKDHMVLPRKSSCIDDCQDPLLETGVLPSFSGQELMNTVESEVIISNEEITPPASSTLITSRTHTTIPQPILTIPVCRRILHH